jgi:hypothetical protein
MGQRLLQQFRIREDVANPVAETLRGAREDVAAADIR